MTVLTEAQAFVLADRALEAVVRQIRDDQWSMPMPSWFQTMSTEPQTLRDIVNYHAYDDAWVPDMLAGRTMAEVGVDAWKGDLLGDEPKAAFSAIVDKAVAAAQALDDPDRTVHCSFGDYTAQQFLWQANGFRGFRAHDLALIIGVDASLPDDLVDSLWAEMEPVADEWRSIGVFQARVPVPDDAPKLDRLLGLVGRDPAVGRP